MSAFADEIDNREHEIVRQGEERHRLMALRKALDDQIQTIDGTIYQLKTEQRLTIKRWLVFLVRGGAVTVEELKKITGLDDLYPFIDRIPGMIVQNGVVTLDPVFL